MGRFIATICAAVVTAHIVFLAGDHHAFGYAILAAAAVWCAIGSARKAP